jgi:hypothetical protein
MDRLSDIRSIYSCPKVDGQFIQKNCSTSSAHLERTVRKVQFTQKELSNSSVWWIELFERFISSEGNPSVWGPNDFITLIFLLGHSMVHLKAITVVPALLIKLVSYAMPLVALVEVIYILVHLI